MVLWVVGWGLRSEAVRCVMRKKSKVGVTGHLKGVFKTYVKGMLKSKKTRSLNTN